MAVTQKELDALACPVCGDKLVLTSREFAQCRSSISEGIDGHGRLVPQDSPSRFRRISKVSELPVAKKVKAGKKLDPAIYEVSGKLFGRISVRDVGKHASGEIMARTQVPSGWVVIGLVPVKSDHAES